MAFVSVKTGEKVELSRGYESRTITYDEWRRQQEEKKRQSGGTDPNAAASPRLGMTGGDTSGETRAVPLQTRVPAPKAASADGIWARGSRYSGIGSNPAAAPSRPASSTATSRGRASQEPERGYSPGRERASRQYVKPIGSYQTGKDDYRDTWAQGLTGTERRERKEDVHRQLAELDRQEQLAALDRRSRRERADTDTLDRGGDRRKELRASIGEQTAGDRAGDVLTAILFGSAGQTVNNLGTAQELAGAARRNYLPLDIEQKERELERYLENARTAGDEADRQYWEYEAQRALEAIAGYREGLRDSETQGQDTYALADRLSGYGAKARSSAAEGLGRFGTDLVDAAISTGQSVADNTVGRLTGTGLLPFIVRAFGGASQEARQGGADLRQQLVYSTAQAAKEYIGEKLFGIAVPQRISGSGGFGSVDEGIEKVIRYVTDSLAGTPGGKKALGGLMTWGAGGATEALEGGFGALVENLIINPYLRGWDPDTRTGREKLDDAIHDMYLEGLGGLLGVTNLLGYQVGGNATGTARGQAETAAGAEARAAVGVDAPSDRGGLQGVQEAPGTVRGQAPEAAPFQTAPAQRDVIMEAAKRGGRLEAETAPVQQETSPEAGTVEPVHVGRVTTIKRPYQGKTPVQAAKNAVTIQVDGGSVRAAQSRIDDARGLEGTPIGELGGFKATLKKKLQESFHPAQGVAVDGVTFDGKPYLVNINKKVVGKVVNDKNLSAEKIALLDVLQDVVRNGEYVGSGEYVAHSSREKETLRFDYFETPVHIGGQDFIARFDVEVLPGQNNYRTHEIVKIDLTQPEASLVGPAPTASSGGSGPVEGTRPLNSDSTITQPSDSVKPSDDGLGAADAGSLNSDYDRLQAQSEKFHKPGEDPARPVDVPKYDFDGNPVSQTASTVMGAKAIPDDVILMIEQMVADGKLSYDPVTNAASEARARAKIEQNGFDGAMEEYRSAVRAGKTSPEIEILGQTLLNNAANARDGQKVAELLSLYQAGGTNLGQALQARKVMRKLSPEGQLYAIQRSVYNIDGENIKVSQDLIQKFLDQKDQAGRDAVMVEIVKDVAGQLPGSWGKIFDSMRYLAMLGNTRTHVRNIIGNALFQPFTWAKNRIGGIGEAAAQRAGVDVERTKTATGVNPFRKPAREARAEYKDLADILNNSSHYSEDRTGTKAIREYYNPFRNVKHFQKLADALDWSLGRLSRGNMSLLEKEDSVFKAFIYGQTLADYLKANGVKSIDAASPELLSKARNYAAQEALRNTFNDSNVVSDAVAQLGRARQSKNLLIKGVGYAVEGTLPFKRTPANVAVRAVEYSPVGGGVNLIDTIVKGAKRELSPADVSRKIDRIAAGLSGSVLGFLGLLAARAGLVTGGDDEDEDQRNFDSLTGHQSYALETEDGTSYTLDWAAPASIPFFMGVELYRMAADGRMSQDDLWRSLKNLGSPMLEMSMLQGLNDTFEEAAYAQRHDDSVLAALLARAATGYFTQVFPTAGGQLERIGEDRRMTTYTDKNKGLSTDMQYTLGKISQKVPGWDYNQIPYIDAWGREEETGDVLSRILQNTISPGYVSTVNVNDVEQELQRIKDSTGDSGVFPDRAPKYFNVDKERKNLTAEEYQTYAKKRGQTALEVMGRMTSSEGYERLSDEQKAQAVKYAYSYADALGKMECSDYKPDSGSMAAGVMKSMLPPEVYILYKINSDRDGNGSTSETESAQTLMELDGLTDKERGEAWSAFNNKGETEEARKRKEAKNPFTGVLAGDYSPEEVVAAWGIFDGKGTKEEKYTQERKKRDLQEELGISAREANDLFVLMKKATGG